MVRHHTGSQNHRIKLVNVSFEHEGQFKISGHNTEESRTNYEQINLCAHFMQLLTNALCNGPAKHVEK